MSAGGMQVSGPVVEPPVGSRNAPTLYRVVEAAHGPSWEWLMGSP